MARPERFELPTTWFEARYSIQLSYRRTNKNLLENTSNVYGKYLRTNIIFFLAALLQLYQTLDLLTWQLTAEHELLARALTLALL